MCAPPLETAPYHARRKHSKGNNSPVRDTGGRLCSTAQCGKLYDWYEAKIKGNLHVQ